MQQRTFTAGYVQPMRDESAPLAEAYAEYAAEARLRLKRSTWRTYDHTAELKRYPTTLSKYGEIRKNGLGRQMV